MPLLLDRVAVIPGEGRMLPRVVAFNPNHDELGRFAEGDGGKETKSPKSFGSARAAAVGAREAKADAWKKAASKGSLAAVKHYQSDAYEDINKQLRGRGASKDNRATVEAIDRAFESAPATTKDLIATRQMNWSKFASMAKPGATFSDKAFVSTTLNSKLELPDIINYGSKNFVNLSIKVPKGSKALYLPKNPHFTQDESELLLPRNSSFKILSVSKRPGGGLNVVAELQKSKPAKPFAGRGKVRIAASSDTNPMRRFVWEEDDVEFDDEEIVAYNPNHDERGRFSESPDEGGGAAGGGSAKMSAAESHAKKIEEAVNSGSISNIRTAVETLRSESKQTVAEVAEKRGIPSQGKTKDRLLGQISEWAESLVVAQTRIDLIRNGGK